MTTRHLPKLVGGLGLALALASSPAGLDAQGRDARPTLAFAGTISLPADARTRIDAFYDRNPVGAEALPPGIRKRLARGKPLPPGIARKSVPAPLAAELHLRSGYEVVEVGLDVLLVEVATGIVHDILTDVVR